MWPYRLVFLVSFVVLTLQVIGQILRGGLVLLGKSEIREAK